MKPEYVNLHTHRPTGLCTEPPSLGLHPWTADREDTKVRLAELEKQLCESRSAPDLRTRIKAVGEIGLDKACKVDFEQQKSLFVKQLDLAERYCLPVVLHCVRAFEPTMEILRGRQLKAVIFHGFIGSRQQAEKAVAAGCYLSFGHRCFTSPKTREALRFLPLSRLFLETDEEPVTIEEIYARATEVLKIDTKRLCEATMNNYVRIFEDE